VHVGNQEEPNYYQYERNIYIYIIYIHRTININKRRHLLVRSEVFTAMTMKNGVFWDVTPCGSCKNRRFGGT
jgi:hypothetical protein